MILVAQVILIIATLILAGKDASSYLLKDKNPQDQVLTIKRIDRWHRDGILLYALYILILAFQVNWWHLCIYATLIRLAIFDIAFNFWAGLDFRFLGSTSKVDQFFVKIFGKYGALEKSMIFLIILIVLNIFLK
jgi:hypothetical protein